MPVLTKGVTASISFKKYWSLLIWNSTINRHRQVSDQGKNPLTHCTQGKRSLFSQSLNKRKSLSSPPLKSRNIAKERLMTLKHLGLKTSSATLHTSVAIVGSIPVEKLMVKSTAKVCSTSVTGRHMMAYSKTTNATALGP